MLLNGVPLLKAVETLSYQEEFPHFGLVVEDIAREISEGSTFSRAIALHPRIFNQVLVTMIEVGEETGALDHSLELVATWLEREFAVRQRVSAAFTYPAGILLVSVCLSVLLFTTVLPTFANIFREMNVSLPLITRVVMGITALICNPSAWLVALGLGVLGWRLWDRVWQSPRQSRLVYSLLLSLPAVGPMLKHGSLTRYCTASQAMLDTGLDLIKTTRLAGQASGNPLLAHDCRRMGKAIQMGETLSSALSEGAHLYSRLLIQMIQAGEEASILSQMYAKAAEFHDMELNSSIELLSASLEPLMLLGVAMMVGGVVLSIYLPMYSTLMNLAS